MPTEREASTGKPIDQGMILRASGQYAPAGPSKTRQRIDKIADAFFGPLNPLTVMVPAEVKGRQFQYPVGQNITNKQRSPENIDAAGLRLLARNCDLIALAIETRKDQMEKIHWDFRVKPLPGDKKNIKNNK